MRKLKKAKARAKAKVHGKTKPKSSFSDYARPPKSSTSTYRAAPSAIAEDDFMASLLSSVTTIPAGPTSTRRSSPEIPSSDGPAPSSDSNIFSSRKRYGIDEEEGNLWGTMGKKPRVSDVTVIPDENIHMDVDMANVQEDEGMLKMEPRDSEEDDDMDITLRGSRPATTAPSRDGRTSLNPRRTVFNSSSVKHVIPKPEPISVKVEPVIKPLPHQSIANGKGPPPGSAHWSAVQDSLLPISKPSEFDEVKAQPGSVRADNVLEDDGNLRIFWLDYMEQDGIVHFVGKVFDRQSGKFVSACVSVNGIQRNLFVKPRTKRFCELSKRRQM